MKLLKIEWLKIKKYNTFWILSGLFSGLLLLLTYLFSEGLFQISSMLSTSFSFPAVWSNIGNLYSWLIVFLSVFAIINISNEFTFKTHRQNIIDGHSRLDFLHSKISLLLFLSLCSSIFFTILCLFFGMINGGGNPLDDIIRVFYVFIFTFNYLLFSTMLAFYIRRSGLSIIILLAYFILEISLSAIINKKLDTQLGNLLPLQCSDELLPWNALKTISKMATKSIHDLSEMVYIIASLVWISIYYFILRFKIIKMDL